MPDSLTAAHREIDQLRALLDLSYSRERGLNAGLKKAAWLLEGAAVAPDREAAREDTEAAIARVVEELGKPPAPPEGLFIRHAKLVCELAGAKAANEYLRRQLETEAQRAANYEIQVRDMRSALAELKAERSALTQLIQDDEVAERVMEAARQLMPEPQFKEGEHRD